MAPVCARHDYDSDVLQQIFLAISPHANGRFVLGGSVVGPERWIQFFPQFTVSRVCSSWRYVALHTPELWDGIVITKITDSQFKIAREYLSRAQSRPVSVCINIDFRRYTESQDWPSLLTDFLSSYRLRVLRVLIMDCTGESMFMTRKFCHILSNLHQWNVANLESLIIEHYGHPKPKEYTCTVDLNHVRYPKLAEIHAINVYKIWGLGSSLRILDGKGLSLTVTEAWDLLGRCPLLELFRFILIQDDNAERPNTLPLIRLQHLHTLQLDRSSSFFAEIPFITFIEALSLPVIERLKILDGRMAWSSTAFQSFALRSDYFPHLQDIHIRNPCIFDNAVLNGLASGSLAPRLDTLEMEYDSWNQEEILDMVELRMKNAGNSSDGVPAPFKKVRIHSESNFKNWRLHNMNERGIPIDGI